MIQWSNPFQEIPRAAKLTVHERLRWAAHHITKTAYPLVVTMASPSIHMTETFPDTMVLKRGFSDGGDHCYFNGCGKTCAEFAAIISKGEQDYGDHTFDMYLLKPRWFLSRYNPSIISLGEYRIMFVGGRFCYILLSRPCGGKLSAGLDMCSLDGVTPLADLP